MRFFRDISCLGAINKQISHRQTCIGIKCKYARMLTNNYAGCRCIVVHSTSRCNENRANSIWKCNRPTDLSNIHQNVYEQNCKQNWLSRMRVFSFGRRKERGSPSNPPIGALPLDHAGGYALRYPSYLLTTTGSNRDMRFLSRCSYALQPRSSYEHLSVRLSNAWIVTKRKHLAKKVQLSLIGSLLGSGDPIN